MPEDDFETWFELQCGRRPDARPIQQLRDEAVMARVAADLARDRFHKVQLWEKQRLAALMAWWAREKPEAPSAAPAAPGPE